MKTINAFHPDYIKTYYPNFTKPFHRVDGKKNEVKPKLQRESVIAKTKGKSIAAYPKTKAVRSNRRTHDKVMG